MVPTFVATFPVRIEAIMKSDGFTFAGIGPNWACRVA